MASIGHPLLGDPVYGRSGKTHGKLLKNWVSPAGIARHRAWIHPSGNEAQAVVLEPMPPDMQELFNALGV